MAREYKLPRRSIRLYNGLFGNLLTSLPLHSCARMPAIAFLMAMAIVFLHYASAENQTSTFIIPDMLFQDPEPMTFYGQMSISSSTTYYTVDCKPNQKKLDFWPLESDCISYSFSASSGTTQYLIPNIELSISYQGVLSTVATRLQNFTQTLTVNCGPLESFRTSINCTNISLYNNEDKNDHSIISPAFVTQSTIYAASSTYPVIFTDPNAAATAAAPQNSLASPTTPPSTTRRQTDEPTITPPSTTPAYLPSGWAYSGCYNDDPTARVLSLWQTSNPNMTVQTCVWSCYELGYSISGLEFREECFCSNSINNGGSLAQWDWECDLPCRGNKEETCGAGNRLSIYSNGTVKTNQSEAMQTSRPTSRPNATDSTTAPSSTSACSRKQIPIATVVAAVIGVAAGIAITIALVYCVRRRIMSKRIRSESQLQTRPLVERKLTWEEFVKGVEEYYVRNDQSTMPHNEGNGSGLGLKSTQLSYRPSIPELREEYKRLLRMNQQSFNASLGSSRIDVASPATNLRPQRAPAQAHLGPPMSILKRSTPTDSASMVQGRSGNVDEQGLRVPATKKLGLAKKGVRFGVNQIREFGRSPLVGHGSESGKSS